MLAVVVIICLAVAGFFLWPAFVNSMTESEKSQGAHYYYGLAIVLAVAWLFGQIQKFGKR